MAKAARTKPVTQRDARKVFMDGSFYCLRLLVFPHIERERDARPDVTDIPKSAVGRQIRGLRVGLASRWGNRYPFRVMNDSPSAAAPTPTETRSPRSALITVFL